MTFLLAPVITKSTMVSALATTEILFIAKSFLRALAAARTRTSAFITIAAATTAAKFPMPFITAIVPFLAGKLLVGIFVARLFLRPSGEKELLQIKFCF
jgi:hypothetical protein